MSHQIRRIEVPVKIVTIRDQKLKKGKLGELKEKVTKDKKEK